MNACRSPNRNWNLLCETIWEMLVFQKMCMFSDIQMEKAYLEFKSRISLKAILQKSSAHKCSHSEQPGIFRTAGVAALLG